MNNSYPTTFRDIGEWASENNVTVSEAKFRFAQYGVLQAIANSRLLSNLLVFKGGNALDFIWQPNRSTKDLDFSTKDSSLGEDQLAEWLAASLQRAGRETGVAYRVQKMERQPPGADKTFVTYHGKVGYALPDDGRNRGRIEQGESVSSVVPLDISLNEPICATVEVEIGATHALQVSSLEDIVAEKLRALLQQPIRNRSRRQDLLDITVILREHSEIDRVKVTEYLIRKAAARDVPVSLAAYRNPEIRSRAAVGYDELRSTTRTAFVPFDEAYVELMAFTDRLDLPAE